MSRRLHPAHVPHMQVDGLVPGQAQSAESMPSMQPRPFEPQRPMGGATEARAKADKRRRQCLLEIERELLRHSSSDEEGRQGNVLQLPKHAAGKRRKTACTGMHLSWMLHWACLVTCDHRVKAVLHLREPCPGANVTRRMYNCLQCRTSNTQLCQADSSCCCVYLFFCSLQWSQCISCMLPTQILAVLNLH